MTMFIGILAGRTRPADEGCGLLPSQCGENGAWNYCCQTHQLRTSKSRNNGIDNLRLCKLSECNFMVRIMALSCATGDVRWVVAARTVVAREIPSGLEKPGKLPA